MEFVSFLMYPAVLLLPFALFALFPSTWTSHRFGFYFFSFLPISLFAALRGESGTDTENYRRAFDYFELLDYSVISVDPIFNSLIALVKWLGLGFQTFAVVHSFLCLLFYSFGAAKLDRIVPAFGLMVLPVLFIDSTFNGLRYGLAFSLATVAIYYFETSVSRLRGLYILAPVAAHSSMGALFFLVPGLVFLVIPFFLVFGLENFIYLTYLTGKSESYSEFVRPGIFSGLMPVFQFASLIIIARINRIPFQFGFNVLNLSVMLFIGGLLLSVVSYAGLRVLQLSVFMFALSIAPRVIREKRRTTLVVIFIVGLIGVANFLRQVFLVGPSGGVAFHPYEFFF